MLTIYGACRSRATRTLWLAGELDLAFTHVPVVQAKRLENPLAADAPINTQSPAFLAINPMGTIPAIEDDGVVVIESLAINLYLAKKYGGDLGPKDLVEEAAMLQWALFAATEIEAAALKISAASLGEQTDAVTAAIATAAASLKRPFDVLEKYLTARTWMVGERFTVADINMAEIVRYAQPHAPLFDERPALKAWLERAQARPAFKAMWEKRLAEPATGPV
ncbi:glutathione S-transferase [Rhizobium sp. RU35A]|uniref:glutathione S-transferase family protein n=1 Tax=Rhizobium sp. RU35A TaxID=1907414 RepID=UPI0009572956|nr:glutathione S-transferase family protein [Rhizobium sp. RU35A]SIP96104.1 glutathione S-transferase [Rhizobium sp. RU35A]